MKTRFLFLFALTTVVGFSQTVTTFAGNGTAGFGGDGGPATQAQINRVVGMASDAQGNIYVAEENNNRVRKIDTSGIITTFAGTGVAGFSGDGGPATSAQFNKPLGVCVDGSGNVYVNDYLNFRVRKISTNGIITTVAGSGSNTHSGDGGLATSAGMVIPLRCAVDSTGNLYIADQGASRVRKVTPTGIISTFAGNGTFTFSGDGGLATAASLNNPTALVTDSTGSVYISDQFNHRIRRVDSSGVITTILGNGFQASTGDGGPASAATIGFPGSMAIDSTGAMYIADTTGHRIRKLANGTINAIAGNGSAGYGGDGGPALQATLNDPFSIAIDFEGNVYFGDISNNRVRVVSAAAAGSTPALESGKLANGATYVAGGLVPGSWAQVKGTVISRTTRIWTDADFTGLGNQLPTSLSGIGVTVNGTPAAVYYISPTQVSFQVPAGISGTATVQVTRNGSVSNSVNASAANSSPGIFPLIYNGRNYPGGVFLDGKFTGDPSVSSAFRKARPGEAIQLFTTGLQPSTAGTLTTPTSVTGVSVTIGTTTVQADAAILVGVGLFQVNFTVPSLSAGDYPIAVNVNGVSSPLNINSDPQGPIVLPIGQ